MRAPLVVSLVVLALIVGGVAGHFIDRPSPTPLPSATTEPAAGSTSTTAVATTSSAPPAPRLSMTGSTPASGSSGVVGTTAIVLSFSRPLSPSTPTPTVSPSTPGSWRVAGTTLVFQPTTPFVPLSTVTVTVPAGVRAGDGGTLGGESVDHFRVADGSILRLQELLSVLDYSPLAFVPSGPVPAAGDTAAQLAALYHPPAGSFAWRQQGWPAALTSLWKPGTYSVFTEGLVMSFQADRGLAPNGALTPQLWSTLVSAVAQGLDNGGGYDYAFASKTAPETLTVYHDGSVVERTPANTGISSEPTPDGTFAVYTRLRRQVMRGKNPNGTRYADLVQYIAYFHGSDAVHYMPRADYGIPQSLGCIELPLAAAAKVWPYLAYGTLVTVVG